jgi:predicted ABC-type transport system involved in lysophospholipase L1 biosynthesis ATPase subunit
MPEPTGPAVRFSGVVVDYRSLRPLRLKAFEVGEGQSVALLGLDRAAASVMVDLITGASLPDTGEVTVLGQSTRDITDGDVWLRSLERFGLLGERTVLVEQLTAEQNLAIPLTLGVDDLPTDVRATVRRVGEEVGLDPRDFARPVEGLPPLSRFRVQLGRALIRGPRLLLAEHPTAALSQAESVDAAVDIARLVKARKLTSVFLTLDGSLAEAVASRVLVLQPGTGEVTQVSGWRRWFST